MKKLRIILLILVFLIGCMGTVFASYHKENITIAKKLKLGAIYKFPNYFDLIDANMKIINRNTVYVECNDGQILIGQISTGVVRFIIYRDPAISLYGMKIGKTTYKDPLTNNNYFIREELSPDGKTVIKKYRTESNDKSVIYNAFFHTTSPDVAPVLKFIEKEFIGDPC